MVSATTTTFTATTSGTIVPTTTINTTTINIDTIINAETITTIQRPQPLDFHTVYVNRTRYIIEFNCLPIYPQESACASSSGSQIVIALAFCLQFLKNPLEVPPLIGCHVHRRGSEVFLHFLKHLSSPRRSELLKCN
jgi:hypothetical protein